MKTTWQSRLAKQVATQLAKLQAKLHLNQKTSPNPIPTPQPVPIPSGADLFYLKQRDQLPEPNNAWNGSFAQVGGRSQSNFILIGRAEVEFIRLVSPNDQLMKWAFSNGGTIYIKWDSADETARWPIILIGSTPSNRQIVRVLESKQGFSHIDAIPRQPNGDYSAYMPDKHPEYWLNAWTGFKSGSYGPSHGSLTFRMPLFDPETFSGSGPLKPGPGLWVDQIVLAGKVNP